MFERVFNRFRSWLFIDELTGLQARECPVQFGVRLERHVSQQFDGKSSSQHGEGLQQFFRHRRKPVDARGKHSLDRARDL